MKERIHMIMYGAECIALVISLINNINEKLTEDRLSMLYTAVYASKPGSFLCS